MSVTDSNYSEYSENTSDRSNRIRHRTAHATCADGMVHVWTKC